MTILTIVVVSLLAADPAKIPSTVADGAKLKPIFLDPRFYEGPAYDARTGSLYFTAFGQDSAQILKKTADGRVSVFYDKTQGCNGLYLCRDGSMVACQGNAKRVIRFRLGKQGPEEIQVVADQCDGRKFNAPNDIVEDVHGGIYFTDPDFAEAKKSVVYHVSPSGKVRAVVSDMPIPNGIHISKDNKSLLIADSKALHVRSYPISEDGSVGPGKVFFDVNVENKNAYDGMTVDEDGNLYASGRGGVWVIDPQGNALGLIAVPEFCSNCDFGGPENKTLYLTCSNVVYALQMKVRGLARK